jgi:hypothetical protein
MFPLSTTTRRIPHFQRIQRIRELPASGRLEIMEKTKRLREKFRGRRLHAPKTQSDQDRHLKAYYEFIAIQQGKEKPEDFTKEELEAIAFPHNDIAQLQDNICQFLIVFYETASPRTKLTGERINYTQLVKVRDSMAFWIRRKRDELDLHPLPAGRLYRLTTEVMRGIIDEYPDITAKNVRLAKTYLGLTEIRELIDNTMISNRSIENAEQHMAAWCIARITACRPGSMCSSGPLARNPPLTWGDLTFELVSWPLVPFSHSRYIHRSNYPDLDYSSLSSPPTSLLTRHL